MKNGLTISALLLALTITGCNSGDVTPKSEKERISYAVGYRLGMNLKNQKIEVDPTALAQAVKDLQAGIDPKIDIAEMQKVMQDYRKKQADARTDLAQKNLEAGKSFLSENKKKQGVTVLKNGIQYKVIEKGKGAKPKISDIVEVHYRGSTINGVEFDSSYKRNKPAVFSLQGVIRGWQDILPRMRKGAKWHVAIPPDMAYGPIGSGASIGPNETLIFEINLIDIKGKGKGK